MEKMKPAPRQHHPLVAGLLGLIGNMLAHNAAATEMQVSAGIGRKTRTRIPGENRPAGSKLVRKANAGRIGVRHFCSLGVVHR